MTLIYLGVALLFLVAISAVLYSAQRGRVAEPNDSVEENLARATPESDTLLDTDAGLPPTPPTTT